MSTTQDLALEAIREARRAYYDRLIELNASLCVLVEDNMLKVPDALKGRMAAVERASRTWTDAIDASYEPTSVVTK